MAFPTATAAGQTHSEGELAYVSVADGANFVWVRDVREPIDEDNFVSDTDLQAPTQQSVRRYADNAYGEVFADGPSGGDDTPAVRALFDAHLLNGGGRRVVLPNLTPEAGGTVYEFDSTLVLRGRETLVVPSGVTVQRSAGSANDTPLVALTRNESRIEGDGEIRSYRPTPNGILKFGPEDPVYTFDVVAVAGNATVTGTFSPVPPVGATVAIKAGDDPHSSGTVVASTGTSVTLSTSPTSSDGDARLYVLDASPTNVLWAQARNLRIRGDGDPSSIGIFFQSTPQGTGFGTFSNTVSGVLVRNVATAFEFDAQANGNQVTDAMVYQIDDTVYRFVNSDENRVDHGFTHNSFGVTIVKIDRGQYNRIDVNAEPGGLGAVAFEIEGGGDALRNMISMSDNVSGGFTDNGEKTTVILAGKLQFGQDQQGFFGSPPGAQPTDQAALSTVGLVAPATGFTDRIMADITKTNDDDATTAASSDPLTVSGLDVGVYEVDAILRYSSDATEDFRSFLTASGGAIVNDVIFGEAQAENDASPHLGARRTISGISTLLQAGGGTQDMTIRYSGQFETTATGGSIILRWAQNTAGPIGSTLRAGSYLRISRIA